MKNSLTRQIYHSFVCKWYKMKTFWTASPYQILWI